jgi:hypothetical protein
MRAAFARASSKSTSAKDKDQADACKVDTTDEGRPASPVGATVPTTGQRRQSQQQVRVKVKSASVESNQTIPTVRCSSLNSYDEDASTSEPSSHTASGSGSGSGAGPDDSVHSGQTRTSSQESLKQRPSSIKSFLTVSPLRPSLSASCLFTGSGSGGTGETDKDCDSLFGGGRRGDSVARSKQQSSSALTCIPTRASLTHEWRKLKTPNKCRECNLLVYFNGRECSLCGFVAHKKCITMLVIKCHRSPQANSNHRHKQQQQQQQYEMPHVANATAQSLGGIGVALFSLRNPNIRPFSNLASPQHCHQRSLDAGRRQNNPIFGQPIVGIDRCEQVLDFINRFIYEIDTRGLTSKGIYRVSSIKSKVDKLCNYYDQNPSNLIDLSSFHPNIIANALKMYLRRLPEPLLTNELYDSFISIARRHISSKSTSQSANNPNSNESSPQQQQQLELSSANVDELVNADDLLAEFRQVIDRLPAINRELTATIMRHLRRVADMAEENQMSSKNLSIIFGPTLLSAAGENKSSIAIVDSIHQARLVELMIDWAYQIFPHSSASASASDQKLENPPSPSPSSSPMSSSPSPTEAPVGGGTRRRYDER